MEVLGNKFRNRSITKMGLGLLLTTAFSYASYANCNKGLSEARQAELINSLQNYEPLSANVSSAQQILETSDADVQRRNEYCDQEEYSTDKYCLERKYMNDGRYLVTIVFSKDVEIPVQPPAPHIKGSKPFKRDTTAREAFFAKWKDAIATEYLGSDYQSFQSVKILGVHRQGVAIKLEVSDASELTEVLNEPRVLRVYHIGFRPSALEEIAP